MSWLAPLPASVGHNATKYNIDTPESIKYCKLPIAGSSPPDWNMDGILIILSVSDSTECTQGVVLRCDVIRGRHVMTLGQGRLHCSWALEQQCGNMRVNRETFN